MLGSQGPVLAVDRELQSISISDSSHVEFALCSCHTWHLGLSSSLLEVSSLAFRPEVVLLTQDFRGFPALSGLPGQCLPLGIVTSVNHRLSPTPPCYRKTPDIHHCADTSILCPHKGCSDVPMGGLSIG